MTCARYRSTSFLAGLGALSLVTMMSCRTQSLPIAVASSRERSPIVIAHRGASGYRPEHTLEAYTLAIDMGADYIEPDLVSTSDGVLVSRHENEIGGTTNVADVFPSRRTTKTIDGQQVEGWFTEDFTLAELRLLRAHERLAFRSHEFDGQFLIPTFEEILVLAERAGHRRGRVVGVYPELKHPTYFNAIGLPMAARLLAELKAHQLDTRDAPVFIQCFEVETLRELRAQTSMRLVQLLAGADIPYDRLFAGDARTGAELVTPDGLRAIATYADAIGVHSRMIVGADVNAEPTALIADAHRAGLAVHVWTLRPEPVFLAARYHGNALAEVQELARLGVDGMFGDYPDQVVQGLRRE